PWLMANCIERGLGQAPTPHCFFSSASLPRFPRLNALAGFTDRKAFARRVGWRGFIELAGKEGSGFADSKDGSAGRVIPLERGLANETDLPFLRRPLARRGRPGAGTNPGAACRRC